ncbi:hypothetical protein Tco_0441724 [Tanacetum coccineum]
MYPSHLVLNDLLKNIAFKNVNIKLVNFIEAELDHGGSKMQNTNEALGSVQEQPGEEEKDLSQEDLQQMMMVVPVEEVYVEALQDMLKIFDRDDLVMLWNLVKERFSSTEPTDDKERALWVELKRERNRYFHAGRERISFVNRSSEFDVG